MFFGTLGRPRRLKISTDKQEAEDMGWSRGWGWCFPGRPPRVLFSYMERTEKK